ncbi:hypothetical protein V9T40_003541 [Parthenolecanium corni]|uniref:Uncharacterized protein n=1 Tax=Parthenolecanium corni TaxID=536013 RepID=A0AAN9T813_9HEMI
MKREVIDHVNEVSRDHKRFVIMEYVLTGEAIKKFIKCNEDAEQVGHDWIRGINFETFQDSDPSDKSDSESDSEYEYNKWDSE